MFLCNNENENKSEHEHKDKQEFIFDQQNVLDMIYGTQNKEIKNVGNIACAVKREEPPKSKERTQVLLVKPDIQNDIYHLFSKDRQTGEYTKQEGVALIPNYETSVLLNTKFRKIKENNNLDALEESDDEDEFEDNREDKFVDLSKFFLFQCTFNFKFKKWVPIKCQEN